MLRLRRPIRMTLGMAQVQALDFLEEDDVGRQFA